MVQQKPDAERIRAVMQRLEQEDWLRRSHRSWWPKYAFHFTDVTNAVGILNDRHIYSRTHLQSGIAGHSFQSSASSTILSLTNSDVKNCARLYFRPRTPTQYLMEGIKSQSTIQRSTFPDAHCPVPVFFLFDCAEVLARDDTWFSDGNLASYRSRLFNTADDLDRLPWQQIYNDGPIDVQIENRAELTRQKCAEIVVYRRLGLENLRFLVCRTQAERETLLHLLPQSLRNRYAPRVVASSKPNLFYRGHTFVETANLTSDSILLSFSPDSQSPGPFAIKLKIESPTGPLLERTWHDVSLASPASWGVTIRPPLRRYAVKVYLDDNIAYASSYDRDEELDIPF